jgi:biopolymer transport protein ExbD
MFPKKKSRQKTEVNASSMADIAFLLLIFFLVTTTIASDKGIAVMLPPKQDNQADMKVNERNVFNILLNSQNQLLVEGEYGDLKGLSDKVKAFVDNNGADPKSSESPQDAVVSIKTDRGTSYNVYIMVQDEVRKAYNELRAKSVGLTVEDYLKLDPEKEKDKLLLDKAKKAYPAQISDAEPTNSGGN